MAHDTAGKADDVTQQLAEVRAELAGVVKTLRDRGVMNEQLNNRIATAVTRAEFKTAVVQQILPRLERIEKKIAEVR